MQYELEISVSLSLQVSHFTIAETANRVKTEPSSPKAVGRTVGYNFRTIRAVRAHKIFGLVRKNSKNSIYLFLP